MHCVGAQKLQNLNGTETQSVGRFFGLRVSKNCFMNLSLFDPAGYCSTYLSVCLGRVVFSFTVLYMVFFFEAAWGFQHIYDKQDMVSSVQVN